MDGCNEAQYKSPGGPTPRDSWRCRHALRFAACAMALALPALLNAGVNTWTGGRPAGTLDFGSSSFAPDPSDPNVLYAVFGPDIYRSGDGGRSWTRLGPLDPAGSFVDVLLVSPTSPSTLYASGAGRRPRRRVNAAAGTRRGRSWGSSAADRVDRADHCVARPVSCQSSESVVRLTL